MKTNLKENIWIEGFEEIIDMLIGFTNITVGCESIKEKIIYSGKTSEIPEELAKECVKNWNIEGLYNNYKMSSQYEEYMFKKAKNSIQSACSQEFCIIYKTTQK